MRTTKLRCLRIAFVMTLCTLSGCVKDLSNSAPYNAVVGKTVYLRRPMTLWSIYQKGDLSSYRYRLESSDYKGYAYSATQAKVPTGELVVDLPIGTALHIDQIREISSLDSDHVYALGTVFVKSRRTTIRLAYEYTVTDSDPWNGGS